MNKKFTQQLLSLILGGVICLSSTLSIDAQKVYQLPNSDFEGEWETGIKLNGTNATKNPSEPKGWNTFGTATGNAAFIKMTKKAIEKKTEESNSYVSIFSSSVAVFKIIANGNMTTGIVNVGSMTATDAENFNYTPADDEGAGASNFRQQFNGRPDAFSVRMKYTANGGNEIAAADEEIFYAQATASILTDNRFQEPHESADNINNYRIAFACINPKADNDNIGWKEYVQDFEYNTNESLEPALILINFGTNKEAGIGSGKDTLCVDDVKFIYYSTLSDIKVNSKSIDFNEATLEYQMTGDAPELAKIEAISKSKWATTELSSEETSTNVYIYIDVKGNDFEVSGNKTRYKLIYKKTLPTISLDKIIGTYEGDLSITLLGNTVTEKDKIALTKSGENELGFLLKDFAFGEDFQLGDINIDNIPTTFDAATETYSFESEVLPFIFMEGALVTEIKVTGTIKNKIANIDIDVVWITGEEEGDRLPIDVTFNGELKAGNSIIENSDINNIDIKSLGNNQIKISGYSGLVNVYAIDGKLATSANINETGYINLSSGIYVIKAGQYTTKIIVK